MALGSAIESFFVYLGFEISTKELEEFSMKVEEAEAIAVGLGAALLATSGAVFAFVSEVSEGIAELQEFAEVNELNIEELQELGFAASVTGSSLEAVKESLAALNRLSGQAFSGIGRGAKFFQKFGIESKDAAGHAREAGSVFEEVAEKVQHMDRQPALSMLSRLGINPNLIKLMLSGADGLAKLRAEAREYGLVTKEDAERAVELKDAWTRLHFIGEKLGQNIAVKLIPGVLAIVDGIRKWAVANREFISTRIVTTISAINIVVGALWGYLTKIVGTLIDVIRWVLSFRAVAITLGVVLAGVIASGFLEFLGSMYTGLIKAATAMFTLDEAMSVMPLLIGLLAAAIFLLADDLYNFYEGNESVIGQLREKYPHALGIAIGLLGALGVAFGFAAQAAIVSFYEMGAAVVRLAAVWIPTMIQMSLAAIGVELPLYVIIIALALVGVAIYELWAHWETVSTFMVTAFNNVRLINDYLRDTILKTANAVADFFTGVANYVKDVIVGVITDIEDLWSAAVEIFNRLPSSVKAVIAVLSGVGLIAYEVWEHWSLITSLLQSAWTGITDKVHGFIEAIQIAIDMAKELGEAIVHTPAFGADLRALVPGLGGLAYELGTQQLMPNSGALGAGTTNIAGGSTHTVQTHIEAPINIVSNDAVQTGEQVAEHLDTLNRNTTRAAQSPVHH